MSRQGRGGNQCVDSQGVFFGKFVKGFCLVDRDVRRRASSSGLLDYKCIDKAVILLKLLSTRIEFIPKFIAAFERMFLISGI